MLRKLTYVLLFISVTITVGHDIIAHHHHFEQAGKESHHNDLEDEGHTFFSYAQLDEAFTEPSTQINIDSPSNIALFLNPFNEFSFVLSFSKCEVSFINPQKFPPPEDYFNTSSHRGPPKV